jgi:hypothetical protein
MEKEKFMLKSDKHVRKLSQMLLLLTVLMLSAMLILASVKAEGTATIWTDKADYSPGETVTIYGSGFIADASVTITVTRPDNSTNECSVTSDSSGGFTTTYVLDGIEGLYTIVATDGTNTATTTFTDTKRPLQFTETGLPIGTTWSVTVTGASPSTKTSTTTGLTDTIAFSVEPGDYPFSVSWPISEGTGVLYVPHPSMGILALSTGSGPVTVSITFKVAYLVFFAVSPSGSGTTSPSATAGFITGSTIPISATPNAGYVFSSWSTSTSDITIASPSSSSTTATIGGTGSITANFQLATVEITVTSSPTGSGFVKVDGVAYDTPHVFTWTPGDSHTLEAISPVAGTTGTQYVYTGWSDGGAQTHTHTVPSSTATVTANYQTQYWVTYAANVPVTLPASEWVVSGESATGVFPSPVISGGTKYVFLSDDRPASITSPTTITATYQTQYYLTVNTNPASINSPTGEGWYDAGTYASISTDQYVDIVLGASRYRFNGWTTDDITEITDPSATSTTVLMDKAKTVTANYVVQYKVTFDQTGVGSDFAETVVTIDGTNYVLSNTNTLPASFWWDDQSYHSFDFKSPLVVSANVKRYVWDTTSGLSSLQSDNSFQVSGSGTITGIYKTQWYVTFDQSGVGSDFSGTVVTVDGTDYDKSGQSFWWYAQSTHSFAFQSSLLVNGGKRYVWDATSGLSSAQSDSAFKVTESGSIIGNYKTQYLLTVSTNPADLSPQPTVTLVSGYYAGGGWYEAGSVVSIDPDSPAGYTFDHWVINGVSSGSGKPLSVTMTSAKNIIAVFTFNLAVETGFKAGDSPSFASDPYLDSIMCVLVKTTGGYKLVGTAPGTHDYAIAIRNTGTGIYTSTFDSITITVTGDLADFYLQSSNPIRVLDANGNDITSQFTITKTWPTSITITSNSGFQGLPAGLSLYATIHLDYAKKGSTFTSQIYSAADTLQATVSGTSAPNIGSKDAYGSVAFLSKKTTIIYGFVKTSSGMPIKDAKIELYQGSSSTPLYTEYTDEDGFYAFINGWYDDSGNSITLSAGVTYTLKCYMPGATTPFAVETVTAKKDTAVAVNFTKKE